MANKATAEENLDDKESFERYSRSHGVQVKGYHAENGIFRSHKWFEKQKK